MFCNLSHAALVDFNELGTMIVSPRGSTLFREQDNAENIYVMCKGQVLLSCCSKEGRTLNLKISSDGDVLGLSAVISGTRLEVTATTLSSASMKVMERSEFLRFLERHGEASMQVAKTLSDEYKSAFADARRLALSGSVAGRLASLLLEWGGALSDQDTPMRFNMNLTHDDLANFTGTSRETVTRTLGSFQKQDLIQIKGAVIHIPHPEKLAVLAA